MNDKDACQLERASPYVAGAGESWGWRSRIEDFTRPTTPPTSGSRGIGQGNQDGDHAFTGTAWSGSVRGPDLRIAAHPAVSCEIRWSLFLDRPPRHDGGRPTPIRDRLCADWKRAWVTGPILMHEECEGLRATSRSRKRSSPTAAPRDSNLRVRHAHQTDNETVAGGPVPGTLDKSG